MRVFLNRTDGGYELAGELERFRGSNVVMFGLPRGGAIVAKTVAESLGVPLDLIVARKIGHPRSPEYAIGAITDEGDFVLNEVEAVQHPAEWLDREKGVQLEEAMRRRALYLGDRPAEPVAGKIAILVDDGIATGYTMQAAIMSVRKRRPSSIVVAAPVASKDAIRVFGALADEVVFCQTPASLNAIGEWYRDFSQVSDEVVVRLMSETIAR